MSVLLNVVVAQSSPILQLFPGKDQALLVWRDAWPSLFASTWSRLASEVLQFIDSQRSCVPIIGVLQFIGVPVVFIDSQRGRAMCPPHGGSTSLDRHTQWIVPRDVLRGHAWTHRCHSKLWGLGVAAICSESTCTEITSSHQMTETWRARMIVS